MSNNQIKKKNLLIICRGAGDLATGIIHRLHRAGHRVIALETDYPAAIRRQVSFCEAVYDGSATVEGLTARLLPALNDAETISGINDTPQAHIASQKWKSSAIEAVLEAVPFNQYHRDPEYRAFWQKKNGVFYMLNSIAFLILAFTPVTSLIYRIIFGIAIVGDLLYLVAYESWNHSAD